MPLCLFDLEAQHRGQLRQVPGMQGPLRLASMDQVPLRRSKMDLLEAADQVVSARSKTVKDVYPQAGSAEKTTWVGPTTWTIIRGRQHGQGLRTT